MAASSSTSDPKQSDDFDSHKAEVLAYRRGASEELETASPESGTRHRSPRIANDVAAPAVVLRMPDLSEMDSEPSWEPVVRPIRYKLIVAALGLTVLVLAICYWVLKADVSPHSEEAPPWDGNQSPTNQGPVKVERPVDGRISDHRPVPTWTVTPLPPVTPDQPDNAAEQNNNSQAGPRFDIPGSPPMDEVGGQTPPVDEPGVAHLQNRIDTPPTTPSYERPRPRLY